MPKIAFMSVISTAYGKANGASGRERQKECEPHLHRTTPASHIHEQIPSRQSDTQIKHYVRNQVARIGWTMHAG